MPCCLNRVIIALLHLTPLPASLWQRLFQGSRCTREAGASLHPAHLPVCHRLSSTFCSHSLAQHISVSIADHHFLFFSAREESHFVSISLPQPLSFSSVPLYYLSFSPSICLRIPHCAHFSTFPPRCSVVALALPLLIHHLLLSTDLFAINKLLQLRDRKIAKLIGICDGRGDGG